MKETDKTKEGMLCFLPSMALLDRRGPVHLSSKVAFGCLLQGHFLDISDHGLKNKTIANERWSQSEIPRLHLDQDCLIVCVFKSSCRAGARKMLDGKQAGF